MRVGTCGWNYLEPEKFGIKDWKQRYSHKLQAYAKLFDLVEVNSSFYRVPRLFTAKKWRKLADGVNSDFEFTLKVSRKITHQDSFSTGKSLGVFKRIRDVCRLLGVDKVLFQTPTSFDNMPENEEKMRKFFGEADREVHGYELRLIWEPMSSTWQENPQELRSLCKEFDLIHCTDPFKSDPVTGGFFYMRLHGPQEYTQKDLEELRKKIKDYKSRNVYVLFDNESMYRNAEQLKG